MNKEVIKRWIKALRSGDYNQLYGTLRSGDQFCATGVLCDLHAKEYEIEWKMRDLLRSDLYFLHGVNPPDEVLRWAGITFEQSATIAMWNDTGHSFKEIATHIESNFGAKDE